MTSDPSLPETTPPALKRTPLWKRMLRALLDPRRKLTRAERRELDAVKLDRARLRSHEAALRLEATYCERDIRQRLLDLGIAYEYKKRDGSPLRRWKAIAFQEVHYRDEAVFLKVDTRPGRMPPGVSVDQLNTPQVLENLSLAVGHPVSCNDYRRNPAKGFWYIVELDLGKRGIPKHVKFDDMLAQRPASADGLAVPLGVGSDKRVIWRSLSRMYSLLVAGTTGGGKSNEINAMICALLRHNSPRKLRLVLVDLKGGVEFSFFQGVPHVETIIEQRNDVIPALKRLIHEGEARLEKLKAERVKNVGEYNDHNRKRPMPHIVVVIDEWADMKLSAEGKDAEELLINISSRFRAVGIHIVLCTQVPNKDVVSIRVKNVLPARLAFACPNLPTSMLIVGDGSAVGLEPAGRAIFDWGRVRMEVQTPYINNDTVDATVAQAIRGEFDDVEPAAHDVTAQEIYEWAVDQNGGYIAANEIWRLYQPRGMSREYAEDFCRQAEGQTVIVGTTAYQVMGASGNRPRRLLPVEEAEEQGEAAPAAPLVKLPEFQEVALWALEQNHGKLQARAVWEAFRDRGLAQKAAEAMCRKAEGERVTIDGRDYRVMPAAKLAGRGARPRRLEPLFADAAPEKQPAPAPNGKHPPAAAQAANDDSAPDDAAPDEPLPALVANNGAGTTASPA